MELFYALDGGRRRRSAEVDFGATWRLHRHPFRLSWIVDTDELIAVRIPDQPTHRREAPTIRVTSHAAGMRMLMDDERWNGEPWAVYVLAQLDAEEVEATLRGWRDVVGTTESLAWAVARITALEEGRAVRKGRRLIPVRAVPW